MAAREQLEETNRIGEGVNHSSIRAQAFCLVTPLDALVRSWSDPARRGSLRKKDEYDLLHIAETHPDVRRHIPPSLLAEL